MLSKNILLFLIITASYSLLNQLIEEAYNYFAYNYYRNNLESILWFIVNLATPIIWGILGFSLQKETSNKKPIALSLSILGGLSLGLLLFTIYHIIFEESNYSVSTLIENLLRIGVVVFLFLGYLLLGIALYGNQLHRIKKACVWLLIGLTLVIINDFSVIFLRIFGFGIGEVGSVHFVFETASMLESIFYISMLVAVSNLYLGILKKEKTKDNPLFSLETKAPNPLHWLGNYALVAIPFVGIIILIIWSFNNDHKIRRNWAISIFLASIIAIAFNLWLFTSVLRMFEFGTDVLFVGLLTLFLFIILGAVLIYRYTQQQPFEDPTEYEHENPSIQIWLANFLIVAIPIIGPICLIIWAIDNKNLIIKNWAIARLIWVGISLVIALFTYMTVLSIEQLNMTQFGNF